MKLKKIKIEDIRPYMQNPRKNEETVNLVAQSIQQYGYNVPITVDSDYVIITGHVRYQALKQLGWTEAECVVLNLDSDKVRQYRIADNKASEVSQWNWDMLIPELRAIEGVSDLNAFFTKDGGLDKIMAIDTQSFEPPTQEEIEVHGQELAQDFEKKTQAAQAQNIQLTCPHCGGDFIITKHDVDVTIKKAGAKDGIF